MKSQNAYCEGTAETIFLLAKGTSVEGDVGCISIKTTPSMTNLSSVVTTVPPAALAANTIFVSCVSLLNTSWCLCVGLG